MEPLAATVIVSPGAMARGGLATLAVLLLIAAWQDRLSLRIPNAVVFGGTLLALLAHTALPVGGGFMGHPGGGLGGSAAFLGWACGIAALLPLHLLRGLGAGDVKLMGMVGAFLGPQDIWGALLGSVLAGGVLALAVAARRGALRILLADCWRVVALVAAGLRPGLPAATAPAPTGLRLPYGVAIAAGTLGFVAMRARSAGLI